MIGARRLGMAVLATLAAVHMTGCYTWQTTELTPSQFVTERQPASVRLTLTDGRHLTLENPEVLGQSIAGMPAVREAQPWPAPPSPPPTAVMTPINQIVAIEERRFSGGRTGVTVGLAAAAALAVAVAVFGGDTHAVGCSPTGC